MTADIAFKVLAKRREFKDRNGDTVYTEACAIPILRAACLHSYVPIAITHQTCFTRNQLHTFHKRFFHRSAVNFTTFYNDHSLST